MKRNIHGTSLQFCLNMMKFSLFYCFNLKFGWQVLPCLFIIYCMSLAQILLDTLRTFLKKCWPEIGVRSLFTRKHWRHFCLSQYYDLPAVISYPSEGKSVTSAYELHLPKWSQRKLISCSRPPEGIVCGCVVSVVFKNEYKGNVFAIADSQWEPMRNFYLDYNL
jgi:hypothetical protein